MWPAHALRSAGLLLATAGVLLAARRARPDQPDLAVRALRAVRRHERRAARLVPGLADRRAADDAPTGGPRLRLHAPPEPVLRRRPVPDARLRAALCLAVARAARSRRDDRVHHLLDRPRDAPWRTAAGAALFAFLVVLFVAGGADRLYISLGIPYPGLIIVFRVLIFVFPLIVFFITKWMCEQLRDFEAHPLRGFPGGVVRRTASGGVRASWLA